MPGISKDPIAEARRQWADHWGRAPLSGMVAVTSLMRAQQILMTRLNAILKPVGLTFPRYEALMVLYYSRRNSMPLGKIGERLQVHPTSVTSLVNGLERSGFIRRLPHETDRRATLAELTETGHEAAERATTFLNEARFCTEPLQSSDLDALTALLYPLRAAADGFRPPD